MAEVKSGIAGTVISIDAATILGHKGEPRKINVEVITDYPNHVYVAVIDEKAMPSGRKLWLNTDTFGSTMCIDKKKLDESKSKGE